jgi:hypothetical protein
VRHYAIGEGGTRREHREPSQLQDDLPLVFRLFAAQRAVGQVQSPRGSEQSNGPELDLFSCEVLLVFVCHNIRLYGLLPGLVSVSPCLQVAA